MTTSANDQSPTRRLMLGRYGDQLVVELGERVIRIRPKGARRDGPAEVKIGAGQLYQRLMTGGSR